MTNITLINGRIKQLLAWILEEDASQGGHGRIVLTRAKRRLSSRLRMTSKTLARYLAGLSAHGIRAGSKEIVITNREAVQALERLFFPQTA
jgi:hypothetical protein